MRFENEETVLEYDDVGQGMPLVLLHGFPFDRTIWRPQLEGLADAARLIAPDLRGFGASGPVGEVATMDDHADDVAALLDSLGIDRAVIAGLSMGGYVALALLEKYPEAIAGLILANTRPGADGEEARRGRLATAQRVLDGELPAVGEGMLGKLFSPSSQSERPELVDEVRRLILRQPPAGVAAALRGMAQRPDRTDLLAGLDLPTLVVTGAADALIPPSESEAMVAAVPGSRLVVVPDAGHLSNLEQPDAFNGAVRELLGEL